MHGHLNCPLPYLANLQRFMFADPGWSLGSTSIHCQGFNSWTSFALGTTFISAFALTQVLMESLNSRGANFIKNLTTEGTRVLAV